MKFLKILAALLAAYLLPLAAHAQQYEAGSTVNLKSVLTGDTIGDTAARPLFVTSGGSGASSDQVQGNVAAGATDAGNPVKIGCVASSGVPSAVTNGQRDDVWCGTRGQVSIQISDANGNVAALVGTNAAISPAGASSGLRAASLNYCYDGTNFVQGATCATSSAAQGLAAVTGVSSTGIVLKASAGNVYDISVVAPASAGYVQLFNLTAVPADATTNTPTWCMPLAASAGLDKTFAVPRVHSTGAVLVFSSTACGASLTKVSAPYLAGAAK